MTRSRIIPALAGNTPGPLSPRTAFWDHPRSRGEYALFREHYANGGGSSPLSREIPIKEFGRIVNTRIIPALAGNTCGDGAGVPATTDHPRSRGEYSEFALDPVPEVGSSPLSRGIPPWAESFLDRVRIIPALAGNTIRQLHASVR